MFHHFLAGTFLHHYLYISSSFFVKSEDIISITTLLVNRLYYCYHGSFIHIRVFIFCFNSGIFFHSINNSFCFCISFLPPLFIKREQTFYFLLFLHQRTITQPFVTRSSKYPHNSRLLSYIISISLRSRICLKD